MTNSNRKSAVILNSRQGLKPVGNEAWIRNSLQAVNDAITSGLTVLTSVGMSSWEIVLFFASKFGARQKVYVPLAKEDSQDNAKAYYAKQFKLRDDSAGWSFIEIENAKKDYHTFQQLRDRQIIKDADIIYPVSIRPNGSLEGLISAEKAAGKTIMTDFLTDCATSHTVCRLELNSDKFTSSIDKQLENTIIHWTRATNDSWPGETMFDYYSAIVSSSSYYPRSGLDTLIRILSEKRLRASSRHYRKDVSAVAFSALKPTEVAQLMKWRARYREMTFEPYGIAIDNGTAERIGIRKVIYGNPEMYTYLEEEDKLYFQSMGKKGYWLPEREYRHIGDVDLSAIPETSITAIVWKRNEIDAARQLFRGKVVSLYK